MHRTQPACPLSFPPGQMVSLILAQMPDSTRIPHRTTSFITMGLPPHSSLHLVGIYLILTMGPPSPLPLPQTKDQAPVSRVVLTSELSHRRLTSTTNA